MLCADVWRLVLSFDHEWGTWAGASLMLTCKGGYRAAMWAAANTHAGRAAIRRALLAGRRPPHMDAVLPLLSNFELETLFGAGYPEATLYHTDRMRMAIKAAEASDFDTVRCLVDASEAVTITHYYTTERKRQPKGVTEGTTRALEAIALHNDDEAVLETLINTPCWEPDAKTALAFTSSTRCGRHVALRHPNLLATWDSSFHCVKRLRAHEAHRVITAINSPFVVFAASMNPDASVLHYAEQLHTAFVRHNAADVLITSLSSNNEEWVQFALRHARWITRNDIMAIMNYILHQRGDLEFVTAASVLSWSPLDFWNRRHGEVPNCPLTLEWAVTSNKAAVPPRACEMLALIDDATVVNTTVLGRLPPCTHGAIVAALAAGNTARALWLAGRCSEDTTQWRHELAAAAMRSNKRDVLVMATARFGLCRSDFRVTTMNRDTPVDMADFVFSLRS